MEARIQRKSRHRSCDSIGGGWSDWNREICREEMNRGKRITWWAGESGFRSLSFPPSDFLSFSQRGNGNGNGREIQVITCQTGLRFTNNLQNSFDGRGLNFDGTWQLVLLWAHFNKYKNIIFVSYYYCSSLIKYYSLITNIRVNGKQILVKQNIWMLVGWMFLFQYYS